MLLGLEEKEEEVEEEAYPGANAAVAGPGFRVLERFALQIEGDGAAVAASAVGLGGCV